MPGGEPAPAGPTIGAIEDATGQRETTTETVTGTGESDVESSADEGDDGDSLGFEGESAALALAALLDGTGARRRKVQ